MSLTQRAFGAAAALALSATLGAGTAEAAARFEAYCSKPGVARAARQTIVIIDEAHVAANPPKGGRPSQAWARFVGGLVDPERVEQARVFAPRERLTVLMARKDGTEPRLLFTGCVPFYSAGEKAAMAKQAGGVGSAVQTFFGSGPAQAAAKDMNKFRTQLGAAIIEAGKPANLSRASMGGANLAASGLIASLRRATAPDLGQGVPRIILYSNLNRFAPAGRDVVAARKAGFALVRRAPADFERAEVHVVGPAASQNEVNKAFFSAWLLGSGGALQGWNSAGLGALDPYPVRVRNYSGVIRYGDVNVPMRLRLATAADGRIVNSWVGVQSDVDAATPFTGNVVDIGGGAQRGRSSGKGLGQLWSANPDEEPEFDGDLPLGGMRRLEFTIDRAGVLSGKVSDPLVGIIQGSRKPFIELRLTPTKALF